jgi:hypothetical protein
MARNKKESINVEFPQEKRRNAADMSEKAGGYYRCRAPGAGLVDPGSKIA